MKVKKLTVCNIGIIENEVIEFNKALNLFYGDIMAGKSTLAINSIKLLFGGTYSDDIIRHGQTEGFVSLEFDSGNITRSFYINKNNETKSRPIDAIMDNKKLGVRDLQTMLNPFQIDQDFFKNKSGLERQKYFVELFGVDTRELDNEYGVLNSEAKTLRTEIKMYGEIDTTEVKEPNVDELINERNKYVDDNAQIYKALKNIDGSLKKIEDCKEWIKEYENDLKDQEENVKKINAWLESDKSPQHTDLAFIDEKISNAKADEIKYEQYQERIEKQKEKDGKIKDLKEKENRQKNIKDTKIKKLAEVSENTGIDSFKFDENGNAMYQDTHMDMLSTSQLMNLSSTLKNFYPESLALELIDRGESLGTSIFKYTEKAEKEQSTILATIVGEKPANVPEDIGVFVVENGKVKK
jgi:DNA repair ATPase RecN